MHHFSLEYRDSLKITLAFGSSYALTWSISAGFIPRCKIKKSQLASATANDLANLPGCGQNRSHRSGGSVGDSQYIQGQCFNLTALRRCGIGKTPECSFYKGIRISHCYPRYQKYRCDNDPDVGLLYPSVSISIYLSTKFLQVNDSCIGPFETDDQGHFVSEIPFQADLQLEIRVCCNDPGAVDRVQTVPTLSPLALWLLIAALVGIVLFRMRRLKPI